MPAVRSVSCCVPPNRYSRTATMSLAGEQRWMMRTPDASYTAVRLSPAAKQPAPRGLGVHVSTVADVVIQSRARPPGREPRRQHGGLFDGQDSRDLATLLRDRQVAVPDPLEGVEIVELVEQHEQGSLRVGLGGLADELDGPGVIEGGVGADDRQERSRLHEALLEGGTWIVQHFEQRIRRVGGGRVPPYPGSGQG